MATNWKVKPIRTHEEVAAIMGISRQNVQNGERDAIRKLRKLLRTTWDDYTNETEIDHNTNQCHGTNTKRRSRVRDVRH